MVREVTRAFALITLGLSVVLITAVSSCRNEAKVQPPRLSATPSPVSPAPLVSAPPARTPDSPPRREAPPPRWPRLDPPRIETDWCTSSVRALDEQTCFALPDKPTDTLLIYFHGVVPPTPDSTQKTNLHAVVANASRRAGAAALLPRGLEATSKRHPRWWTWPTAASTYRERIAELVSRVERSRRGLEALAGTSFKRVYIAGSSAGAYFVCLLALHGDLDASGFGVLSGGAGRRTPELDKLAPKPVYVGYGVSDPVSASARAFGRALEQAGWPVRIAAHPLPHGAREIYLDEAFAFWREHAR